MSSQLIQTTLIGVPPWTISHGTALPRGTPSCILYSQTLFHLVDFLPLSPFRGVPYDQRKTHDQTKKVLVHQATNFQKV